MMLLCYTSHYFCYKIVLVFRIDKELGKNTRVYQVSGYKLLYSNKIRSMYQFRNLDQPATTMTIASFWPNLKKRFVSRWGRVVVLNEFLMKIYVYPSMF